MTANKALLIAGITAGVGAFIPTLMVLGVMADNNNNGELYDTSTGEWDVGYALAVSAIYYIPAFLIIFALTYGLARLWRGETNDS